MNTTARMSMGNARLSDEMLSAPSCNPELASTALSEIASRKTGKAHTRSSSQRSR